MKRIAIFAHFDKNDIIDDYVIYYLQGLKKVADDIIFVSDCNLPTKELKKLDGLCFKTLAQKHGEYDFGSYKRGILEAKNILNNYDELIIANDSCYGSIFPFENVFEQMEKRKCDFWGLTQNKEILPAHIQSFFITFRKKVFLSDIFQSFFQEIEQQTSKTILIEKYEIGLTQTLIKAGFRKGSFFKPFRENPMADNNALKLLFRGMPLIKVSLLKENGLGIGKLYKWKNHCSLKFIAMVENHLQRVIGTKNPAIWYYYKQPYINFSIFHRKFIRILLKKGILYLKVFGITLLRIRLNRFYVNQQKF